MPDPNIFFDGAGNPVIMYCVKHESMEFVLGERARPVCAFSDCDPKYWVTFKAGSPQFNGAQRAFFSEKK